MIEGVGSVEGIKDTGEIGEVEECIGIKNIICQT